MAAGRSSRAASLRANQASGVAASSATTAAQPAARARLRRRERGSGMGFLLFGGGGPGPPQHKADGRALPGGAVKGQGGAVGFGDAGAERQPQPAAPLFAG